MRISVITNATPIIGLSILGQLDLLGKLFEKIYVTRQVYDEVVGDNGDRVGSIELKKQVQDGSIVLYDILDKKFIELMYGRLHKDKRCNVK